MTHSTSLKLFTIRGVELRVDFSLLLLAAYVIFVAAAQFPYVARSAGVDAAELSGSPAVWGVLFALGLFCSIVLHEFGHVLVAQASGVKVRSVTLMMLGGVSEMDRLSKAGYTEFKVSVIGPLVSLALYGLLSLLRS